MEEDSKLKLITFLENLIQEQIIEQDLDTIELLQDDDKRLIEAIIYLIEKKIDYDNEEIKGAIKNLIHRIRNINPNDIIITRNDPSVSFRKIFMDFGYLDYDNIGPFAMQKLENYAKEENVTYVLDFFNKYLSAEEKQELIPNNCKLVVDLIVFFDKESIDKMSKFIEKHNINIMELVERRPSIFFKKDRNYIINSNMPTPSGELDSYMESVEATKRANEQKNPDPIRVPEECLKFFTAPLDAVIKNKKILDIYGVDISLQQNGKSTLNGKHIAYILDRCIELNEPSLIDYIQEHPRFLEGTSFPFRFYKIKRALALGETLYARNRGLRSELIDERKSYAGIDWNTTKGLQTIEQEPQLPIESKMASIIPGRSIETESKENLFDYYYKYSVYTPKDLIPVNIKGKDYLEFRNRIMKAINNPNQVDHSNIDYSIIRMLDQYKYDDIRYLFIKEESKDNPKIKISISRPKVLRLCKSLKEDNIEIDLNDPIAENIVLSLLVKDSILSNYELDFLRFCIKEMIKEYTNQRGGLNDRFSK